MLALASLLTLPLFLGDDAAPKVVVHEWGTFTSIAGKSGASLEWDPLVAPTDLPQFVRRTPESKGEFPATVRMETPVLYFYADRETKADVSVKFPRGKFTEVYPWASTPSTSEISWNAVRILPGAKLELPRESGKNHYYAAREVDAAPLSVSRKDHVEHERFLFYRGAGTFELPLVAKVEGDAVRLSRHGAPEIARAFLFERRGDSIGWKDAGGIAETKLVERPRGGSDLESLLSALRSTLVEQGLYPKEASSMVETWRDAWFEEGARVLYVVPRSVTDEVLPLTITPKPAEIVRVLVGRTELITPERVEALRKSPEEAKRDARFAKTILREASRASF